MQVTMVLDADLGSCGVETRSDGNGTMWRDEYLRRETPEGSGLWVASGVLLRSWYEWRGVHLTPLRCGDPFYSGTLITWGSDGQVVEDRTEAG